MNKEIKQSKIIPMKTDFSTTYENFYDKSNYGNLEYPVSIYQVDFEQAHTHSIRWHWHEEMEILLINNGYAKVTTDDHEQILRPGQGFILNQNVMHSIHSIEGNNCTYYSLVFHPDFLFGYNNSYLRTNFLLPMQSFSILKTMLMDAENAWHKSMLAILEKVLDVNRAKSFGYEMVTKGYLCQFWATLLNKLPMANIPHSSNTSLNEQRVKQAMLYIRLHHADAVTLDDIAASISVSKSECCRCFKATIQMTPFEYLMKYRIFEASRLILDDHENNRSIAELALSVGFNSISYFNKLFRRYLGCTPTEYRMRVADSAYNIDVEPFAIPMF
ncbi:MAG: AraC family transcriptional regulator [Bacillus sp. (in: Bacteria)]|nr:AraC family transcriptional regulator [Bacillus sp. (in: firmicutes)]MCM1425759.1 AraC family transcriptional regulator [Eubacterium sp.]